MEIKAVVMFIFTFWIKIYYSWKITAESLNCVPSEHQISAKFNEVCKERTHKSLT